MPSQMKRLKQLEEENTRLKKIEADLPLDREMLQDVIKRSFKAYPKAGAGRRDLSRLDGFDRSCLWSAWVRSFHLLRQVPSPRAGGIVKRIREICDMQVLRIPE